MATPRRCRLSFFPVLAGFAILAALGVAYLLSALTVAYRDFRYLIPVGVQLLLFLSPVIYPVTLVPERYQWLLGLNPMAGIIDGVRSAILGKPWNMSMLMMSAGSALILLFIGATYFRMTERKFADIA